MLNKEINRETQINNEVVNNDGSADEEDPEFLYYKALKEAKEKRIEEIRKAKKIINSPGPGKLL